MWFRGSKIFRYCPYKEGWTRQILLYVWRELPSWGFTVSLYHWAGGYSRDCSIPTLLNILYKEITQNQLGRTWMFKIKINSVLPCYSVWNYTSIVRLNLLKKYNCAVLQNLPWPFILLCSHMTVRPKVQTKCSDPLSPWDKRPRRGPYRKLATSRTQTINHEPIFGRVLAPQECVINEFAVVRLTEILNALKH